MNEVDLALQIATVAHAGQKDRDGEPYILHPLTVGLMGRTDAERCAGFLHDVIEDTECTAEYLLDRGIHEDVVNALKLLTHDKSTPYYDYVQGVLDSKNPVAIRVKYHDLCHNYARGKAYPDLQKKHLKALQMVKPVVEAMDRVEEYQKPDDENVSVAVFAAGCFWGVQHYFQRQQGVLRTMVGYTGGEEEYPTYDQVRTHKTSHFEAILVEYDNKKVTYEDLCKLFFEIHDPAQTDGQGPDYGEQYRSVVFIADGDQLEVVSRLTGILREKGHEVNTMVRAQTRFWIAEPYHQHYYAQTGGSPYCHMRVRKF